jgi:hypothetical protein
MAEWVFLVCGEEGDGESLSGMSRSSGVESRQTP